MKKSLFLLLCIFILSACSYEKATYELCGVGPMMVMNGKNYIRVPVERTFKLQKELGKIQGKIHEDYHPIENFTSNFLDVGSSIYSVKGNSRYLLAKTKENQYLLFQELNELK